MNIPKSKLKTAIANRRSKFGEGDAYSNPSSERLYHRAEHIVQIPRIKDCQKFTHNSMYLCR